jgi:hypothetical protein
MVNRGPTSGTACQPGLVDALELPRATATGWRMLNLVWPKRIDCGRVRALEMAGKRVFPKTES